jgi:hypothetical protein
VASLSDIRFVLQALLLSEVHASSSFAIKASIIGFLALKYCRLYTEEQIAKASNPYLRCWAE